MVGPSARKAAVKVLVQEGHCSERKAYGLLGVARSSSRYREQRPVKDAELRERIAALASKHKRYGYRRITALLRREGLRVNKKRVHRLWKKLGLGLKRKRPKRRHSCAHI